MSNNDQYALNWSYHPGHIRKAFQALFQRDEFVDVTLSCEGKKIKAHRIILSACSAYFHDLLQDNPCPHPIVVLRDFKYENIKNIVMFMYNGEVQVPTENFGSFLKTAEILEVCGLTGESQAKDIAGASVDKDEVEAVVKERVKPAPASKKLEREQRKISESKKRSNEEEPQQQKKKKEKHDSKEDEEDGSDKEFQAAETVKITEPRTRQKTSIVQELLGGDMSFLTKESNPECECPICAQKFASMFLLKEHVPLHLGETKCQYCGSSFARRDILRKHQINVHKISPNLLG